MLIAPSVCDIICAMLPEPSVEAFMRRFFQERTAALKHIRENHLIYWRGFYDAGCDWDSRRHVVEDSAAEEIEAMFGASDNVQVVTKGNGPFRSRYHLKNVGESWCICEVDTGMPGERWVNSKDTVSTDSFPTNEQRRSHDVTFVNLPEPMDCAKRQPVLQFMSDHFRERTSSWAREAEIYGSRLKSFYSAECGWERYVVSAQRSEAERIDRIELVDEGAHVITSGFDRYRNRYCLTSAGDRWSIKEVDNECPVCVAQGRNANCFWCAGSIWEHTRPSNA